MTDEDTAKLRITGPIRTRLQLAQTEDLETVDLLRPFARGRHVKRRVGLPVWLQSDDEFRPRRAAPRRAQP